MIAQPIPTLPTQRLVLRGFTLADVEALYQLTNQPQIMQYFPNPYPPDWGRAQWMVENQLEHWARHAYGWWAVTWPADCRLLGWCGLQYLPATDEVEVGYLLDSAVWGQGLATEAAREAVRYGFTNFPLPEIIGITHPDNRASQRVLGKTGLTFTTATPYFGMACYRFAITRADWARRT